MLSFFFHPSLSYPSLHFLFCFRRNKKKCVRVALRKRAVCILCACLINLPRLEWMCLCLQVHESATVPPEGSFVPHCWFMSMCYGVGYRLRASQPAASQLCKGSWWITIHWGKSTFATPANTSCLACSQGEIPSWLPETWKHKVRAVAKNSTQVQCEL